MMRLVRTENSENVAVLSILYHNPPNSRDAEISESNAELAALQREAAELATELRVSTIEA